ncbi:lysophospholipid acyltransferase family protein [Polluticaenibacter yanchengensis]|uniref:Lysophospholipid acyltransferase family protein n=1 Tax=Polluticaenibacter yanchengensis TaxID=3014562 RepID=A0ABT4UL47_9BACT|nr:lysophospholipid acyltransferase family protein [Chitinophagaceae bacterium LY-5]
MNRKDEQIKLPAPKYSFLVEVFGRIWAFWGLIVFLTTMFIVVVPVGLTFLIPEPYGVRAFKAIAKIWMTVFLNLIGCPIKVYGKDNYNPAEEYVITSNHRSLMDVPLLTPFFPGANKTIAKKSFSYVPLFGWIYTRGSVLVDRKSDASRKKSLIDMRNVLLKEKLNMALYPEGTRNRTGKPLKSFYDGAFRLAVDCNKKIIPVVMRYTDYVLPAGKPFFLLPNKLEMHILEEVEVAGKQHAELKAEVFDKMWRFIERNDP